MRAREVNMLEGSVMKGLFAMALPIILMNVFQQLFNAIDMTVLGKFANDAAVGAVGACSTHISLFTGLVSGLATGANVVISRFLGHGDRDKAERAVGTSLIVGVIGGFALLAVGVLFARGLLVIVDCDESLLAGATRYFRLYFCGLPAYMVYFFGASILRARGETRLPMIYLLIGAAAKVVLNFALVAGLHLTVEGVGYASIAANLISAVLTFRAVYRMEGTLRFSWRNVRVFGYELRQILLTGIPVGLETALYSVANLAIAAVVNGYGPDATTGYSIASQCNNIVYHVCVGSSYAVMPYVAQNVGAGNLGRVRETVRKALLLTTVLGGAVGWSFAIFARPIASLMSKTPVVIDFAAEVIVLVSGTYFLCGIMFAMNAVLRGLGRPIVPTVSTMVFMFALRFLWVWFVYPLCPTPVFLYAVWPVGWVLCILTTLCFYFPTMRRMEKRYLA